MARPPHYLHCPHCEHPAIVPAFMLADWVRCRQCAGYYKPGQAAAGSTDSGIGAAPLREGGLGAVPARRRPATPARRKHTRMGLAGKRLDTAG